MPPLENPEEAPGHGTALTIRPTSEWENYWGKLGDILSVAIFVLFVAQKK